MRVLGLDTATRSTVVGLLDTGVDDDPLEIEHRDDPPVGARPRHTARLLALAADVLAEAGVGWDEIDRIAVGIGPGTFTGIRIGVATARALAAARGVGIVGVCTLHAVAAAGADAAVADGRAPLAVLDARRREVFAAGWAAVEALDATAPARLSARALAPDALADDLAAAGAGADWLALGDGALDARAALEAVGVLVAADDSPLHRVSALAICRLGLALPAGEPDDVHPEYLRVPDAELTRRAAVADGRSRP